MTRERFNQLADEAGWTSDKIGRDAAFETMPAVVKDAPEGDVEAEKRTNAFLTITHKMGNLFAEINGAINASK